METVENFNLAHIISLELRDKELDGSYIYKPEFKLFGKVILRERFVYVGFVRTAYFRGDFKNDVKLMIEDNKIYYKPRIIYHFSDDTRFHRTFDNYNFAKKEYDKIINLMEEKGFHFLIL